MSIAETSLRLPIPPLPRGFRMGGVHAGLKRNPTREDITLIVSDLPATAAGVYTTNLVFAAPVAFDRDRTPGVGFRGIAINSGNANACTGTRGLDDARSMAQAAAEKLGVTESAMLVLSTGIIGEFLPLEKIKHGFDLVASTLESTERAIVNADNRYATQTLWLNVHRGSYHLHSFWHGQGRCDGWASNGYNARRDPYRRRTHPRRCAATPRRGNGVHIQLRQRGWSYQHQ